MVKKTILKKMRLKRLFGLKVISVIFYILAVLLSLSLLLPLFTWLQIPLPDQGIKFIAPSGLIFISVMLSFMGSLIIVIPSLIGLAVLFFFIAKGVWNNQKWAKIGVIVFAALDVLISTNPLAMMSAGKKVIFDIVISLSIIIYLSWLFYVERKKQS